ncbi:FtsX-like permease family protein [Candidatus Fermentibacteria bacterium]|nr:FtsX-like permease family protein [Candidatus Fermentibacteria bacterium]
MGSLSWHLAWRNIRRHPHRRRFAFASVVSVAGVTLGVAALVVVTSVLGGLEGFIEESVLTVESPLSVVPEGSRSFSISEDDLRALDDVEGVSVVSPYVEGEAVVRHPGMDVDVGCRVRGVDAAREFSLTSLPEKLSYGNPVLRDRNGFGCTIMGLYLAEEFRHCLGDTLLFFPPASFFSSRGFVVGRAVLSGAVETGLPMNDQSIAYLPLELARMMYMSEDEYSGISVWLDPGADPERVSPKMRPLLPDCTRIITWQERNPDLTASMKLERMGSFLAILLITLVATFNIVGTVSRSVVERRADISILKAMGATGRLVLEVFLWQGILVGAVGVAAGLLLGLAGCWALHNTGLVSLPDVYSFHQQLPVAVAVPNLVIISLVAMALSVLSAAFPAFKAARLDPVKGLHG